MAKKLLLLTLLVTCLVFYRALAQLDYYKILGVKKSSSANEIKKAYRKLSMKYHPDKNPAAEAATKFEEISEAYEILGNKEKKKVFDDFGHEGLKNQFSAQAHHDPFDIFSQFGFGGGRWRQDEPKTSDVKLKVRVTLKELFFGEVFDLNYRRQVLCTNIEECQVNRPDCQSPGVRAVTQQLGPGFVVSNQQHDPSCVASGKAWRKSCSACPKGMTETESIPLTLNIERGAKHKEIINFEGVADQQVGHRAGDLVFEIIELKHPTFKREGDDLWMDMNIPLKDALVGFNTTITHISGESIPVSRKDVTPWGHVMKIPYKGMPIKGSGSKDPHGYGTLHIKFQVQFPKKLSEDVKKKLKELL